MTRLERLLAVQEKDAYEMRLIEVMAASGVPPDAACALVVGGEFRLSEMVEEALRSA